MSLQHTPGPWIISADPMHFYSLTTVIGGKANHLKNGPPQQMIVQVGGFAEWQEAEANARLIAAAPELLEALETLAEHFEYYMGDNECRPLENARAAIAKAAGGQS